MDDRELLLARLNSTREALMEAFGRLTDEVLSWAPVEGMRTLGGQIVEVVATEQDVVAVMEGREPEPWDAAQERIGKPLTIANLRSQLENSRMLTLALVAGLTDDELARPSGIPSNWHEAMGLPNVPVVEVLRGVACHEAYHTGQLVSYLWAKGDNPYEWHR